MHLKLQSMIHAFQSFLWLRRHRQVMRYSESCYTVEAMNGSFHSSELIALCYAYGETLARDDQILEVSPPRSCIVLWPG